MTKTVEADPVAACEAILLKAKDSKVAKHILFDEVEVADRLLSRRIELIDAYGELHRKLGSNPTALYLFFEQLVVTAALYNPQANAEAREDRSQLEALNNQIADMAADLAGLLDKRSALHNTGAFYSGTHYHPLNLVEEASEGNALYRMYVHADLAALRRQFDLKYWPSISECLMVLASDAAQATTEASDPLTEAATRSPRQGLADFVKALFVAIEECNARNYGQLPSEFSLSDASWAALVTCVLDRSADRPVAAEFVKRLRQRERARSKAA